MYGYNEQEEISGGGKVKFGLNKGFLTKFEYNPNGGKEGAEQDCFDVTVNVEGREFRQRFYPVTKVFREGKDTDGGEITDTTSDEYKEAVKRDSGRLSTILSDYVKCFIPKETLQAALATPINTFKDYVLILERLVKNSGDFEKTPIHVFLQYQWQPKGDNDRTYLELPATGGKLKHIKQGTYVTKFVEGDFGQNSDSTGIEYINENGVVHTIKRTSWYAGTAWAKVTKIESAPSVDMSGNSSGTDSW